MPIYRIIVVVSCVQKEFSVMVCMRYILTVPGNVFAFLHRSCGINAMFMLVLITFQFNLRFLHGDGDQLLSIFCCDLVKKERLCTFTLVRHGDELRYFCF